MIHVRLTQDSDPLELEAVICVGDGETRHQVTMARGDYERLQAGQSPDKVVEAAFRFLLDREPKEAIRRRFDLTVISRYFREFERELPRYLEDG